ncbi:MAG TPA: hypothetical protein VGP31_05805 [Planosporangium sp.]|jgi:hypothetical protein|nr:hypothetical protein [Planosporangium sp.]
MAKPTEPNIDWDWWLGTVVKVVDIAGKILPIFLGESALPRNGLPPSGYNTGGVQWTYFPDHGQVWATNLTDREVSLCFATSQQAGGQFMATSLQHPLEAYGSQSNWNATEVYRDFLQGSMTANMTEPTAGRIGLGGSTINFAIRLLAVATAVRIFDGWTVTVDRTVQGRYQASIQPGTNSPFSLLLTVRDMFGNSVTTKAKVDQLNGPVADLYTVPLEGIDLSTGIVAELDVVLEVPTEVYQDATREQRASLRRELPQPLVGVPR